MQTQDAPAEFLFKLWPWLEANKNKLIGVTVAVVVIVGIYYFINWRDQQKEINAGVALTQLLAAPPSSNKPTQAADSLAKFATEYSGTAAAQRAELQSGASYFDLGRYADAEAQFKKFLGSDVIGPLAATAELGYAASLEAQKKLNQATTAYARVTSDFSGTPSALTAQCALGRIAEDQGKWNEALTHYEAAARSGNAGGTLAREAAMHYSEIKARLAAASETKTAKTAKTANTTNSEVTNSFPKLPTLLPSK